MATITGLTPDTGPAAGGTPVVISGDALTDVTDVGFGGTSATDVTVLSDTSVTATTPAGAGSAIVTLVWADGTQQDAPQAFVYVSNAAFGDVTVTSTYQITDGASVVHPISAEPVMPDLTVTAPVVGTADDANLVRRFRLDVTYDDGHRHDTIQIPSGALWDVVAGPTWTPDFGGAFYGGDLSVFVEADLDTGGTLSWSSPLGAMSVLGLNPAKEVVRNRLDNMANLTVVFHRESRFTQFKTGTGIGNAFVVGAHPPLRGVDPGGTVGYGIGQLTTDPIPEPEELWNWLANVDFARGKLLGLRQDASVYQQQVQQGLAWTSQTGGKPPHEGVAYPDAPDFTKDEVDLEMYSRYNSGYRYHDYHPETQAWERRLPLGGDAGTSLPYADALELVKQDVLVGILPPGW
jgi:hypothetical protein